MVTQLSLCVLLVEILSSQWTVSVSMYTLTWVGAYQFKQKSGANSFIEGGSAWSAGGSHSVWTSPLFILLLNSCPWHLRRWNEWFLITTIWKCIYFHAVFICLLFIWLLSWSWPLALIWIKNVCFHMATKNPTVFPQTSQYLPVIKK